MPEKMVPRTGQARDRELAWLVRAAGMLLAFAWGLAEATFFFVIPDVVISLAAVFEPKRAWRHVVAAVLGSMLGGGIMYSWAARAPERAQAAVVHVPFVRAEMFAKVHAGYGRHGAGAVFIGPFAGIPYKIYAVEAPEFLSRGKFLAATVPARGERFALIWIVFGAGAAFLRRFFRRSNRQLVVCHAVIWSVVYAIYWGMILLHG